MIRQSVLPKTGISPFGYYFNNKLLNTHHMPTYEDRVANTITYNPIFPVTCKPEGLYTMCGIIYTGNFILGYEELYNIYPSVEVDPTLSVIFSDGVAKKLIFTLRTVG